MRNWITLTEAARQLDVRAQTVYAYVSRGRITVMPDPRDPRKSLYRASDVAALRRKKQVGRKREALAAGTLFGSEPCIQTAITAFAAGRPYYRGHDVIRLSATATLEEVAAILWQAAEPVAFHPPASAPAMAVPGRSSAFVLLAELAACGHSTHGRADRALHAEAGALVGLLAQAFGARAAPGASAVTPVHERLALAWNQGPHVADLLRASMVLVADHELTSSAFSARITASTGASLPACLLSGLATFSGPLHGDASVRVRAVFDELARQGAEQVVAHYLRSALPIPGFGHHLYPDGDPRAQALLGGFSLPPQIAAFIRQVEELTGLKPNIDVALAALVDRFRLPADAAFALFATARSVGLLAHCLEQLRVGMVIRPRGLYNGVAPDAAMPGNAPGSRPPDVPATPSAQTLARNRIFPA